MASRRTHEGTELMLTYRNRKTGRVVDVAEEADVTPGPLRRKRRTQARRTLEKLNSGRRWERISDPAEIEASRQAYREAQEAGRRVPARPAPTPVYVVNTGPDILNSPTVQTPDPEPAPAAREDGIHHSGGPWFEVVVNGETVDKVQGRQAAEERHAELSGGGEGGGW